MKIGICSAVMDFLNVGDMPEIVNSTVLVLIPKVKTLKIYLSIGLYPYVMFYTSWHRRFYY
jgi:hypothetical protein